MSEIRKYQQAMKSNDNSLLNQLQNPTDLSKSVIDQDGKVKDVTKTNFNDLTGLLGTSVLKQDQSNLLNSSNLNDASGLEKLTSTDQSLIQAESETNSITVQNQVNLPMIDRDKTMQVIIEESQDHETTFEMSQMDRTQNNDGAPILPSETESMTH